MLEPEHAQASPLRLSFCIIEISAHGAILLVLLLLCLSSTYGLLRACAGCSSELAVCHASVCLCTTGVCGLQYECGGIQRNLIRAVDHVGPATLSVWAGLNAFVMCHLSDAKQQQPLSLANTMPDFVPHCLGRAPVVGCSGLQALNALLPVVCAARNAVAAAPRAGSCRSPWTWSNWLEHLFAVMGSIQMLVFSMVVRIIIGRLRIRTSLRNLKVALCTQVNESKAAIG